MKNLILFLLLFSSISLSAQIDRNRVTLTSDTTHVSQDTTMWLFTNEPWQFGNKMVTLRQADLVMYRDGQRQINLSSGALNEKEYKAYLRGERGRIARERDVILKAAIGLKSQIDAITEELKLHQDGPRN